MRVLGPTRFQRLNEAVAIVLLGLAICLVLSFTSYQPQDPSWDTATSLARAQNRIGLAGAFVADLLLQAMGMTAYLLPFFLLLLAGKWLRSRPIENPFPRAAGALLFTCALATLAALGPNWELFRGVIPAGGLLGLVLADILSALLNQTGAVIATGILMLLSLYLLSTFSLHGFAQFLEIPGAMWSSMIQRFMTRRKRSPSKDEAANEVVVTRGWSGPPVVSEPAPVYSYDSAVDGPMPEQHWPEPEQPAMAYEAPAEAITSNWHEPEEMPEPAPIPTARDRAPWEPRPEDDIPIRELTPEPVRSTYVPAPPRHREDFELPPTELLNEPSARSAFDTAELKDTAAAIKSKFEEFNVLGSVTQINPGPVVTTFEFKPEAGIKLSRITGLSEDLCLGLQAESVLIERIPGKPTVGIEVPNTKREVISLRQILESDEFRESASVLTLPLGKDINGRIKVTAMETMPHLLIAGSTGAGKSVMLNSMIMSILYKSTPNDVRMIMVDPKRVELGIYEGIPHLLTPVITDPKKATNALRNAVLEMEKRLKILAAQGVRNIDQYNRKLRDMLPQRPVDEVTGQELHPLPYILILIDELADLMMLERANVEEAVTRLAQMARAVGMHLVLATQRPSVDVITGLIKANFPARISFRVATRVDSRTILDSMGAEHLLGKGDMLFLPPGSSRLMRVHGAFVTEAETHRVVEFWKEQARPEYDQSFLAAPPSEEGEAEEVQEGEEDPAYRDAVRVVLEMGKASTSTLQRRLRLGYGRAARILDMMQRDGIIGPPDGSRPREVLRRPDWLDEPYEYQK